METRCRLLTFLGLTAVLSGAALADSHTFVTIDVPGSEGTVARGLNNSGQIVGTFTQASRTLGFLYDAGTFSPIEFPGAILTNPSGINNAGQIAGFYDLDDGANHHGFLYADGSFSTIDAPGATATQALGINDLGQVVGTFTDARGEHGFIYQGGTFTTIDVPGATATSASGINNASETVGTYTDINSAARGFRYAGDVFSDVPKLLSVGINDAGQMVGGGAFSTIEVPGAVGKTYPTGIDNAGQIAGFYFDAAGLVHGFLAIPIAQSSLTTSGADTAGLTQRQSSLAMASAGSLTAKVSSSAGVCDVNGNGVINVSDVQLIIKEALGTAQAANDLNGDHVVNVADIQVVMNAVLQRGCTPVPQQGNTAAVAHLTVQSGNGQVLWLCFLAPACTLTSWQPLSVKATNSSGSPVAGATVSWTVTNGSIMLGALPSTTSSTSVTDSNGIATQSLSESIFAWSGNNSYDVNNIQATSNSSVTFTETQALQDPSSASSAQIQAQPPQFSGHELGDAPLSYPTGTTLSIPIIERVAGLGLASNGVPNIAVRIINQQSSPTLTCVTAGANADPGSVLTDAQGYASCYPVFGGVGTGSYYLTIGGVAGGTVGNGAMYFAELGPFSFSSTSSVGGGGGGGTAGLQIVSGNPQSVPVNNALQPLVAKLSDGQGNALAGQTMVWSVSPAFAATLPNGVYQTDINGLVTLTGATLSSGCGASCSITVAVQSTPSISATFHLSLK